MCVCISACVCLRVCESWCVCMCVCESCCVCMCVCECVYLGVAACGRLLVSRAEGLQLRVQDVQHLLQQAHRGSDITGVDPPLGVVDQHAGDVCCVLPTLNLHTQGGEGVSVCVCVRKCV